MNLKKSEQQLLVKNIVDGLPQVLEKHKIIVAPPFPYIDTIASQVNVEGAPAIFVAAQTCASEPGGAFTGDVSAAMLADVGATYVLVGHSERRQYHNESNEVLLKKLEHAFAAGLQVIFCCGEPLEVREAGTQNDYVAAQIAAVLGNVSKEHYQAVIVAYEPIWAIGTGLTATSDQAQSMHEHIRSVISGAWGPEAGAEISILYGGSCNEKNAAELFSKPDVDGGLIGGASLKAESFLAIIKALKEAKG